MDWLFLRGLSREQRHWGGFPAVFSRIVPGARVHCLDLPGAGTEHQRASPATIAGIMGDVRERWLDLRRSEAGPWGLLAMSLGGMVAMEWCASHPGDFARVVLAGTSAGDLSPAWKRFGARALPGVARAMVLRDPVDRERIILETTTRLHADRDRTAIEWARYHADRPLRRGTALRQIFAGWRYRAPLRLTVPALILAGARDPMVDPSCSLRLAERFGAPCEVHPGGGHELALDAPEWLAERVAAWVGVHPGAGTEEADGRPRP